MRTGMMALALAFVLALAAPLARAAEEPLVIKNEFMEVKVDAASGRFTLTALPSGKAFVKNGDLGVKATYSKISKAPDNGFGEGQAIMIGVMAEEASIVLYPRLPFALFIRRAYNDSDEMRTMNRITQLTAPVDLGLPLEKLRVLGTGGLSKMEGGELKTEQAPPRAKKPSTKKNEKKTDKKAATAAGQGSAPKPLETPKPTFSVPPTAPEDKLGSYVWLAVAEPQSRNGVVGAWLSQDRASGVVGAWLSQDRASGVVFPRVKEGRLTLEAQLHYGVRQFPPRTGIPLEYFVLGYFDDARLGLEAWADAVAKYYNVKLPPQPVGYCTWYMEKFRGASDEKHFAELSEYAAKELAPYGFNFVQIDDGWQAGLKKNGPKKNFNTIEPGPKSAYPGGMKATAEKVTALGLIPGIWFMPFAGNYEDPFFADKQEMFVKRKEDGKPYETSWGGTCLDMTNPKTQEYLRQMVSRISKEWGYKLFKMDGMWTGTGTAQVYVNNGYKEDGMGDAVFHDPKMTNIEAYRKGLRIVREAAGKDVFLLGCCVSQNMRSLCGALGLVDAMRIGPDTGSGHIGSPHASRNYFMNGRVWWNDPDCVSVRAQHPLGNARANASFTAISGDLYYNSDWIPDLPAERLEILKRTMAPHGLQARPVDLFEQNVARVWLLSDARKTPRRDVVALFNWDTKQEALIEATLEHIGLDKDKEYVGFDYWANKPVGTVKGKIAQVVPADSCVILALRPASAEAPGVLSTSQHVTQGMVDVLEEKWDAQSGTLSGRSKLVGGDPYELRLALPQVNHAPALKVGEAAVSLADKAAGVKVEVTQGEPGLARVKITAPASREVAWSVKFVK